MDKEIEINIEDISDYAAALRALTNKGVEIADWKITRGLEEAKLLSVNSEFQRAVAEIRKRWNIIPKVREGYIDALAELNEYASHLSDEERKSLYEDLRVLATKFNLEWSDEDEAEDQGLIVAAVCYGLTPDTILNHWDKIKYTIAKSRTPGIRVMRDTHSHIKEKIADMTVIAYLFLRLRNLGVKVELPEPIRGLVMTALKSIGKVDTAEKAVKIIQQIQEAELPIDLSIRIEQDTTLEDIKRTWPQVELRKIEFLKGRGRKKARFRKRVWRTYSRDIFIWKRVNHHGQSYKEAYDEWLSNNPEEQAVEISAVIKSVSKIKDLPNEDGI